MNIGNHITRSSARRPSRLLAFGCLFSALINFPYFSACATPAATQLPTGGSVASGQASIASSSAAMTVTQSTQKAVINWSTFNVGADAQVTFNQPNASSQTLNRVVGSEASQIFGKVTANGQIFLINPNGVVFGNGAQVSAAGVVASMLDITDQNFQNGVMRFERNGTGGDVTNEGTLTATNGGYVALLGVNVTNRGGLNASGGKVLLASGDKVEVPLTESGLISIEADVEGGSVSNDQGAVINADQVQAVANGDIVVGGGGSINAQSSAYLSGDAVTVRGAVHADNDAGMGGAVSIFGKTSVLLSGTSFVSANGATGGGTIAIGGALDGGSSAPMSVRTVLENGGFVQADATDRGNGGTIIFWSVDQTKIAGTILAQGGDFGGDGGFVETSSIETVKIENSAVVNTLAPLGETGMWLLDPPDYTIAASGGDETGASVSSSLTTSNRTITTSGSIYVNDAITWSANRLTLNATAGDVVINALMTTSGTAGLTLTPSTTNVIFGFAEDGSFLGKVNYGGSGSLIINGTTYTIITSLGVSTSTTGTDLQGMRGVLSRAYALGADIDASATAAWNSGAGFTPIGTSGTKFTGRLEGLGHTITGLTINRPATSGVGLVGYGSAASKIRNLGIVNATITGDSYVGSIAGDTDGLVTYDYAAGSISGDYEIGGLVGNSDSGTITHSHFDGSVTGQTYIGGIVGFNYGTTSYLWSSGSVVGTYSVGGVMGYGRSLSYCHSSSTVSGNENVGGLAGEIDSGVSYSYATGDVYGTGVEAESIGGLLGTSWNGIQYSYATGNVTAGQDSYSVGGLAGYIWSTLQHVYATGNVTGGEWVGGIAGGGSSVRYAYATGNVSGVESVGGIIGYNDGTVRQSYATGNVSGNFKVGGLVGENGWSIYNMYIYDSFATGNVTGTGINSRQIGGLVGLNDAQMHNSYSLGTVSGDSEVGGLVGTYLSGSVSGNYWNIETSGLTTSGTGTGLTSAQMRMQSSFPEWDFSTIWSIAEGVAFPTQLTHGSVNIISGTTDLGSMEGVRAAVNGGVVGAGSTYADGAFYIVLTEGSFGAGDDILLYHIDGGDEASNAVYVAGGAIATGLVLDAGTLWGSSGNGVLTNTAFSNALGGLSSADILYTASGNDLTITAPITVLENSSGGGVSVNGAISSSGSVTVQSGAGTDITIEAAGSLSSTASGTAITLDAGRSFINNAGAGALAAPNGRWLIFSPTPGDNTYGGLNSNNTALWHSTYGDTIGQEGNRYVFAYQPTVTFTSVSDTKFYGDNATAQVAADYAVSGLHGGVANAFLGDTNETAFSGVPSVTSEGAQVSASVDGGPYEITASQGTLLGVNGYALDFVSSGELTVVPALLRVNANPKWKTVGRVDPALTFSTFGLKAGDMVADVLTGALTRAAGESIGFYSIDQGTVSANTNYTMAFTGSALAISPVWRTVDADPIKTLTDEVLAEGGAVQSPIASNGAAEIFVPSAPDSLRKSSKAASSPCRFDTVSGTCPTFE